ncbi:Methylxanthine N3-demethylase NdmB [Dissostichus eleginoides]|uniref:Methylxanthine N3-demethylase NdmB n=1 Tax=Dissostichus eleginoides TaxID=100907 RepID=A0AAD9F4K5_DISEL|nr:Methylxanthine N3-demethylase NdmB [Dissostichus eleginoides]
MLFLSLSRQPVLLLLLFITLKEDPWRVFTVPRFPSVLHASKRAGAFVLRPVAPSSTQTPAAPLPSFDVRGCPAPDRRHRASTNHLHAQFDCTQQDLDGPQSQGPVSQEAE